ncbi:unnamed protein product [Gongylonema pulchrum]|uniref:Uncharacterized protein n=1 Tax=Gongylonema pulchrum TaxID=637853 RepID=A0A183DF53_9BILA|nr:unnamed protein product [Gongylonema pulchrum]
MNRLTWYQPGEYMEDIIIQSGHVGIYDGDLKQVLFFCILFFSTQIFEKKKINKSRE